MLHWELVAHRKHLLKYGLNRSIFTSDILLCHYDINKKFSSMITPYYASRTRRMKRRGEKHVYVYVKFFYFCSPGCYSDNFFKCQLQVMRACTRTLFSGWLHQWYIFGRFTFRRGTENTDLFSIFLLIILFFFLFFLMYLRAHLLWFFFAAGIMNTWLMTSFFLHETLFQTPSPTYDDHHEP